MFKPVDVIFFQKTIQANILYYRVAPHGIVFYESLEYSTFKNKKYKIINNIHCSTIFFANI